MSDPEREPRNADALPRLLTPALLVQLDRVRANVERMLELLRGSTRRWRPHVKTIKIPEVLDLLLQAGVRRFKCATTGEARVLLERAAEPIDLLAAMSLRGANLERLAQLAREHPRHRLSLLTEDPSHAEKVRAAQLDLFVDLDPGYGRTGVPLDESERIAATARAAGGSLRGLHCYEGQLRSPRLEERRGECHRIFRGLAGIARALLDRGCRFREIVTSGTPTFTIALDSEDFAQFDHQVSPGTVVYWDTLSEAFQLTGFEPAVTVLSCVISRPRADLLTCDAGAKAIDAAAGRPCARVEGWPSLEPGEPSEEHLPLRVLSPPAPEPGRLIRLVPAHVCPTVNLHRQAALFDEARFVGATTVAAAGHELLP